MKVVGIGLGKTGTTTLAHCLQYLGYKHRSFNRDIYDIYARGDLDKIRQIAEAHDSFDDHPWPELYKDMDQWFPGSKFVLTVRKDPETWLRSLETKTMRRVERTRVWHIYGMDKGVFDKDVALKYYLDHNRTVHEYFKDRPDDLLEVCWETGDGWGKLAPFLGHETPDIPLPQANPTRPDKEFFWKEMGIKFLPRPLRRALRTLRSRSL